MKTGIDIIAEERDRQINTEGYTLASDLENYGVNDDLALAAAVYATPFLIRTPIYLTLWPWEDKWYKPTPDDRVRELAKAGALIAAEIDRYNMIVFEKTEQEDKNNG